MAVYEVTEFGIDGRISRTRAIEAPNAARAIKFASDGRFKAEPVNASRLGDLLRSKNVESVEIVES